MNEAFMTSPIGDLPINSNGLRSAIDEIRRLENLYYNAMQNCNSTLLHYHCKGSDEPTIEVISRACVINNNILYFERRGIDAEGEGIKLPLTDIDAWFIEGCPVMSGLLRL